MAYGDIPVSGQDTASETSPSILHIDGPIVELPDASYVRDADMVRDGMDLVLDGPQGAIVIKGYFASEQTPNLVAPDGSTLTPALVESFAKSPAEFAQNASMTDESPVGAVQEVSGEATVTRLDGTVEEIAIGTPIYQGDIIETDADGAVNIVFADETSFAVSEEARLAIDEYVFDPATQSGSTDFSVLKGVFVFTSGLIGRDDPDDVQIDTPVGSIGIRGTIIAGNVDTGEITVVEGAIVLRDTHGNEMTLANQFETAKFNVESGTIDNMGELSANDVGARFSTVSHVSPSLFSSINDAAEEQQQDSPADAQEDSQDAAEPESSDDGASNETGEPAVEQTVAAEEAPVAPPVTTTTGFGTETASSGFEAPSVSGTSNTASSAGGSDPAPVSAPAGASNAPATASPAPAPVLGTTDAPPSVLTPPATTPPGFTLDILGNTGVAEGTNGGALIVATLQAVNGLTSAAGFTLTGAYANLFEVVNGTGTDEYDVRLKAGSVVDWEKLSLQGQLANFGVNYSVTTANGTDGGFLHVPVSDVNEGGVHTAVAPPEYFTSAKGIVFHYFFDNEFKNLDLDTVDPITYELSATTIAALNAWNVGGDILVSGGGGNAEGWSFNSTTGELQLYVNGTLAFTPGSSITQTIEIQATDGVNNSGFFDYDFVVYNPSNSNYGSLPVWAGGKDYSSLASGSLLATTGNDALHVGVSGQLENTTIFMGMGNDSVTLYDAFDNSIYLGDGVNDVTVLSGPGANTQNRIYGADDKDTFNVSNIRNSFYGMGGDDDFVINLADTTGDLNLTGLNALFDGGDEKGFRAGHAVDAYVDNPLVGQLGRGDSLIFTGTGPANINLTAAGNDYFKGIERIDFKNGGTNLFHLNYDDVVQMTDFKKTLVINLDANDTLQFDVGTGTALTKVADNVSINDAHEGSTNNFAYDVYSDGNITLIVQDTGATLTGTGLPP
jgi:hypothetical protein